MIILQCNDHYFKWLDICLRSLKAHNNDVALFISIYNGCDEMKQQCLDLFPTAIVELDLDNRYQLPIDQYSISECMAVRKGYVLADVCDRFQIDWALMLDVDLLCRGNLIGVIHELMGDSIDLAVIDSNMKSTHDVRRMYNSSVVFVKKDAFYLTHRWAELMRGPSSIMGHEPMVWFWDQVCLAELLAQVQSDINIRYLQRSTVLDEGLTSE